MALILIQRNTILCVCVCVCVCACLTHSCADSMAELIGMSMAAAGQKICGGERERERDGD